jgi:hypothetical protein
VSTVLPTRYVRTEDHNGDGRPDVWRTYDRDHRLLEVAVDTNFDGRSDVREYYERDALVRRESDRDFNDRVDLVEEFDPGTRQRTRSVVDVDNDGSADLLVLFRDGQAVFTKWVERGSPVLTGRVFALAPPVVTRTGDDRLLPLQDPFRSETVVTSTYVRTSPGEWIGLSSSGGLPAPRLDFAVALAAVSDLSPSSPAHPFNADASAGSPRGPPAVS